MANSPPNAQPAEPLKQPPRQNDRGIPGQPGQAGQHDEVDPPTKPIAPNERDD
jgi:hypothetical protein